MLGKKEQLIDGLGYFKNDNISGGSRVPRNEWSGRMRLLSSGGAIGVLRNIECAVDAVIDELKSKRFARIKSKEEAMADTAEVKGSGMYGGRNKRVKRAPSAYNLYVREGMAMIDRYIEREFPALYPITKKMKILGHFWKTHKGVHQDALNGLEDYLLGISLI